jgi:hypothetical protein
VLTVPYVTVPEFRAHPTYLDTNNLRVANTQAAQDAALNNALLTASQWADDYLDMPLAAHLRVENTRIRPDRQGRLRYHPEHAPVLQLLTVSTGDLPDQVTSLGTPQAWTEAAGRVLIVYLTGAAGLGNLQFGAPPAAQGEILVTWTYVAGWPHTQLQLAATTAATQLTVADTTGITAGTVLRLWTPTAEEAVTVAAVAGQVLALAAPLAHDHPAGMSVTALPPTARQAVINYAVALLARPAPGKEANFPAASATQPSSTSKSNGVGGGLVADAQRLLGNYQRIR